MLGRQPRPARILQVCVALLVMLGASPAWAEEPAAELDLTAGAGTWWELGTGLNLGEVHLRYNHDRVWGELSTVVGVPLASIDDSDGVMAAAVLAVGYGLPLAHDARGLWVFDLYAEVLAARLHQFGTSGATGGAGFGFGFRWVLDSGLVVGFRMPCFGMALEEYNSLHPFSPGSSLGDFFLAAALGSTIFTVGYRF